MLKCNHCNYSFRWIDIIKANWMFSTIECNKCEGKAKITYLSRIIVVGFTVVPFLIFGLFLTPFENVIVTIIVAILIAFTGSLFTPFLVKYKNQEKSAS